MGVAESGSSVRRALTLLASVLVVSMALVGCADAEDEVVSIVCTNSVLADFTSNLFGDQLADRVSIEYIMPAGVCPSHFDTKPSDVVMIASADVVISLGWEPWLEGLLVASGNDDCHQIRCMGLGEWNYPSGAAEYLDLLADGLADFAPAWADTFADNAVAYSASIAASYESAKLQIESLGLNGTKVVTIEWHSQFLSGLGFEIVAAYGPPEGLSTGDVIEISAKVDDPEVAVVVDNLQSTVDFGGSLAAQFGKEHVVLSNFPGAIPGKYTYMDNMAYNVEQLVNAATAYKETRAEISELESRVSSLEFQRLVLASVAIALAVLLAISIVVFRRRAP